MKAAAVAALAAVAGVSAQASSSTLTPSYITIVTYQECSSTPTPVVTDTSEIIVTTCPECTHKSTSTSSESAVPTLHTTVYTTSYDYICSTGFTQHTYTVTETCSGTTPVWPMSTTSNYVPPGFTTTVTVCTVCNENNTPSTVTLTVPCDTTTSAASTTPTTQPTRTGTPKPATTSPSGGGTAAPPASTATTTTVTECPGPKCMHSGTGTTPSGPEDTTTTVTVCPGPQCKHTSSTTHMPVITSMPTMGAALALAVPEWRVAAGAMGGIAAGVLLL